MYVWLWNADFETKLWGDLLNIRKDPGVSRFEFEIGFSVEASVEFYITSSICIEKRTKFLKEMMDKHEIYSNKKPPPKKKNRKMLILRKRSWKSAKHWQKIEKMQAWVQDWTFYWIFCLIQIYFLSIFSWKKSNNQIIKNQKRYICLQIQILKLKSRQSAGHWKFRLNFILEFGAESSVEYLISCMFFMCVFSGSFCFCAFCWIPICFLYLHF